MFPVISRQSVGAESFFLATVLGYQSHLTAVAGGKEDILIGAVAEIEDTLSCRSSLPVYPYAERQFFQVYGFWRQLQIGVAL